MNIKLLVFLLAATLVLTAGQQARAEKSESGLTPRNQDPGHGVVINASNLDIEIEIYRLEDGAYHFGRPKEAEKIMELTMKSAGLSFAPEVRGNRVVSVAREYLNLPPGRYFFAVYPTKGLGIFKRQLERRTFELLINDDPTDYVYNGRYVGWILRFEMYEPDISPNFQFRIN